MEEKATTVKRRSLLRREFNPLLTKELRGRMRGARAFVVLTVYLLLISCVASIIYYSYSLRGKIRIIYYIKALYSGEFTWLPTVAQGLYHPQYFGRNSARKIIVREDSSQE